MNPPMVLCAISDRNAGPGDGWDCLLRQATRLAQEGIAFFQLREKDLPAAELAALARALLSAFSQSSTRVVINGRADIAMSVGAHGVHLTSKDDELLPTQVRQLYASARLALPVITASCHTLEDVRRRRAEDVDAILFGPVFEKSVRDERLHDGIGVERLGAACAAAGPVPVLALGGVTAANIDQCSAAGASGVAGIRLFHR